MGCFSGPEAIEDNLTLALDAANTKSYPGSGTTWTDLSGKGNNVTLTGATYNSSNSGVFVFDGTDDYCLLYTSPSPRDRTRSRMPSSA